MAMLFTASTAESQDYESQYFFDDLAIAEDLLMMSPADVTETRRLQTNVFEISSGL